MASTGRSARALDLAALALVFAAGLWIAVGENAVELLIASAYRGESWAVWNGIFSGRHSLPLEHYLAVWRRGATGITLVLMAAAGLAALLARRAVQARLTRQLALEQATWDASAAPLSAARRRLANLVIGGVVFGSLAAIAADREVWPFCTYGMYSQIVGSGLSMPRVYGVPREPGASELALFSDRHLHPFDPSRLLVALGRLEHAAVPSDAYRDALPNLLALYRAARAGGRHDGPELRGLRLYRVRWELDPWGRNVDRPDSRELLAEHLEPPLDRGAAR